MTVSAEDVVLRFHNPCQRAHEDAAFAGQVTEHFAPERRGEKISGADANADRQAAFFGATGAILLDGKARIDTGTGQKIAPDGSARTFGSGHNYIDVFGRDDSGLI